MSLPEPQPPFEEPHSSSVLNLFRAIGIVAVLSLGFAWAMQVLTPVPKSKHFDKSPFIGTRLPEIDAEAWINGDAPTPESLEGKVVVLDIWAYWCGPCVQETRHLVTVQKQFAGNSNVVFLGATGEPAALNPKSQMFLDRTNVNWPNAVGSRDIMERLRIESIPAVFVTDRKGLIIWTRESGESIEKAIERGLKE